MASHPGTQEADYSRSQIQNIVNAVVPKQELLDAQTNLVSATVDRQIAVYQVLDAMGRLTAQRLGLNVPIYDPAAYYNAVKDAPTVNVSPEGKRLDRVLRAIGKE